MKRENVMGKIKKDFMMKELRRLLLCAIGFAVCSLVLWRCYPKLASCKLLLLLGIVAILAFAALRSAIQARAAISHLTDNDIYLLDQEYTASHPVYKVWQGEIHLLQSFIVCRNRGRLLFIPIHKIERVERRFDRVGMQKIPFAKFIMDTDRSIAIGFSTNHAKDSEAVFAWLAKRLGSDKVM